MKKITPTTYVVLLFYLSCMIYSCSITTESGSGDIPDFESPLIGLDNWYLTPTWTPDGEWIAYCFTKTRPDSVFSVRTDGSDNHPVCRGMQPHISPDGSEIAVAIGQQIFVYNIALDYMRQLTFAEKNYWPRWSPDGKQITYDSNLHLPSKGAVVWIMDPDGSNKKDISIHEVGEWRYPNWTPDFNIIYAWAINGWQLFTMDTTGQNHNRLTYDWDNILPSVSKDGQKIIWEVVIRSEDESIIKIMDRDGSNKTRLTPGRHPALSPDGRKIAFIRDGETPKGDDINRKDPKYRGSLWVYNISTKEEYQVLP